MFRTAQLPMDPEVRSVDPLPWIVGGLFLLIGGGLLSWGVFWFVQTAMFLGRSVPATGLVVRTERSSSVSYQGQSRHAVVSSVNSPVLEFRDASGEIHRFQALGSTQQTFQVGARVPVLYDPIRPERASINSFDSLWMRPILLIGFGGVIAGLILFMVIMEWRQRNSAPRRSRRRR